MRRVRSGIANVKTTTILVEKPYCVYYHWNDNELFYVGSGKSYRPFVTDPRGEYVRIHQLDEFQVEIVCWFDTQVEARQFELQEISRLAPTANIVNNWKRFLLLSKTAQPQRRNRRGFRLNPKRG